jgi:putative MFS transporter
MTKVTDAAILSTGYAPGSPPDIASRLERIPPFGWHIRARLILGIGTFFDAFDLLAITFAIPAFQDAWHMTPGQIGLVLSAAFFGQLFGALLAGWFAERWGRLYVANLTIAMFSIMSLACALAWNPASLIVFRFIQGIGLGGEVPIATTYIAELSQARIRGRFYVLYELIFVFGLIGAGLLGTILVPWLGWQSMFILGALPALLTMVLRRLLPESPRWLASRGRAAEADAVVANVERLAAARHIKLAPPMAPAIEPSTKAGDWREMFSTFYRGRTFAVWAMWFCCFSTTYGLTSWLPSLYRSHFHLPLQQALFYGLVTNLVGICGSIACALFVDRVGRRRWFTGGLICGGAVLLPLAFISIDTAETLLFFVSAGSFFLSTVSIGLNLYTPELYPTRMRAFASSVGGAWQRVAAFLGPMVVGTLLPLYGLGSLFFYFGGLAILGGAITWCFAVETAGRELEEISP